MSCKINKMICIFFPFLCIVAILNKECWKKNERQFLKNSNKIGLFIQNQKSYLKTITYNNDWIDLKKLINDDYFTNNVRIN